MIEYDHLGNPIFDEDELIEIMYHGNIESCHDVICKPTSEVKTFNQLSFKKLKEHTPFDIDQETFDQSLQEVWLMPEEYKNLDILDFLEKKCNSEKEVNRLRYEFKKFSERNLENLLKYMVYLVDIMKANNIIWGVGRGSSVSSFILYLIGIHKVDPIKYNLDFSEFMK